MSGSPHWGLRPRSPHCQGIPAPSPGPYLEPVRQGGGRLLVYLSGSTSEPAGRPRCYYFFLFGRMLAIPITPCGRPKGIKRRAALELGQACVYIYIYDGGGSPFGGLSRCRRRRRGRRSAGPPLPARKTKKTLSVSGAVMVRVAARFESGRSPIGRRLFFTRGTRPTAVTGTPPYPV